MEDWTSSEVLLSISKRFRMSTATASTSSSQVLCFSTSSRTRELQGERKKESETFKIFMFSLTTDSDQQTFFFFFFNKFDLSGDPTLRLKNTAFVLLLASCFGKWSLHKKRSNLINNQTFFQAFLVRTHRFH